MCTVFFAMIFTSHATFPKKDFFSPIQIRLEKIYLKAEARKVNKIDKNTFGLIKSQINV